MQIRVSGDPAGAAARWLSRRVGDAVRRRGRATLALSGGSTAPAMIAALDLPWEHVEVWQVDERVAPDGHPARNANQLAGLACPAHLMPVTASDLRAAARHYAARLPDQFDVVHLGVGDDGHTASWPPDQPQVAVSKRSVELTGEFNGWPRMTLTARVVNAARARVVLARGEPKRAPLHGWVTRDHRLPVHHVRRAGTWLFTDNDPR
jgi:6-phosphogluconolactonase/glucosamine-6-phosphate isomerase/deaminase